MKKIIDRILILPFLLFTFSACTSVQVRESKADQEFDLAQYETFAFYDDTHYIDSLSADYQQELNMIKKEMAEQMQARGLRQSSHGDLLLNIDAVVEEKVQTRTTNIWEAPPYIGQRRYSWESQEVETGRYKLGTVTLQLLDREQNKLVWEGVAEGVLPKNQEKLKRNIEEGVSVMFEKIPYSRSL